LDRIVTITGAMVGQTIFFRDLSAVFDSIVTATDTPPGADFRPRAQSKGVTSSQKPFFACFPK
jgi:hypothetical protein